MSGDLRSGFIQVIPQQWYLLYAEFSADAGGVVFGATVYWYKGDRTTAATPSSTSRTETLDGSACNYMQEAVQAPDDAKWARVKPYCSNFNGETELRVHAMELKELLPLFNSYINLNQTISAQGATVINFDSQNFDTTNDYDLGNKSFHPRSDGFYELDSTVRVYAADGSQVPSYIDLYDELGAAVVAVGPVVGAVTAAQVAHFPLHVGPIYLLNEMILQIRFHAFGACTVYSSGSWYSGRALL